MVPKKHLSREAVAASSREGPQNPRTGAGDRARATRPGTGKTASVALGDFGRKETIIFK
jgi:hypothetical protein